MQQFITSPEAVQKLVGLFPQIHLIYLFGSRADATAGPNSDYDFALLLADTNAAPQTRAEFASAVARLLVAEGLESPPLPTGRVDVIILNETPVELAFHVIACGLCLYKSSEYTRVEYEATVLSRYGDFLPILRQQRTDLHQQESMNEKRIQRYRETLERTQRALAEAGAAYIQST